MITMETKKHLIEKSISLGMAREDAYILAECTETEVMDIENDKAYQRRLTTIEKIEERDLLQYHDDAMKIALAQGKTSAVQWKLSKINPERWGNKVINDNRNKDMPLTQDEHNRISKEYDYIFKEMIE